MTGAAENIPSDHARRLMRRRRALSVAFATWLLACLTWFALLGVENASTLDCVFQDERVDSSDWVFGQSTWRWLPPGTECRYEVGGFVHVDEPPTARLGVAVVLLAWPLTVALIARATHLE